MLPKIVNKFIQIFPPVNPVEFKKLVEKYSAFFKDKIKNA